jgi:hypothetical protein
LWEPSNREVHSQLIAQLEGDSEDFTLNFNPLIVVVFDQLGTTKLGFIKDQIELGPEVGVVKFEGANLDGMRNAYNYFQNAMIAIIVCAILSLVLCVLISVNHLKTLCRVALAVGIFTGILAASISATTLIKSDSVNAEQKVAIAVMDATTRQLRISLIIISVICIAIAVGSKVYAVIIEMLEGLTFKARLKGVEEVFHLTLGRIRKNEDGDLEGSIEATDEYGLEYVEDTVNLPRVIEWAENGQLIYADTEGGEAGNRIVSKKVVALIGGATIAGAIAGIYTWNHKRKT